MIESLVIGFFGAAILFTILAEEKEDSVMSWMLSFFFWVMTGAGVIAVNRAGETTLQSEWGLAIPFVMLGAVMGIQTISVYMNNKKFSLRRK